MMMIELLELVLESSDLGLIRIWYCLLLFYILLPLCYLIVLFFFFFFLLPLGLDVYALD